MHRTVDEALPVVGSETVLGLTLLELSQRPLSHLDVAVWHSVGFHPDIAVRGVASLAIFKRRDLVAILHQLCQVDHTVEHPLTEHHGMVLGAIESQFLGDGAHETRAFDVDLVQLYAALLTSSFCRNKTRGAVVRLSVGSRQIT